MFSLLHSWFEITNLGQTSWKYLYLLSEWFGIELKQHVLYCPIIYASCNFAMLAALLWNILHNSKKNLTDFLAWPILQMRTIMIDVLTMWMCKSFNCTSLCRTLCGRLQACVKQSHAYKLPLPTQPKLCRGARVQLWPAVDWRETGIELLKKKQASQGCMASDWAKTCGLCWAQSGLDKFPQIPQTLV